MSKQKCHNLGERILERYKERVSTLPPDVIGHFFQRAYRLTGNKMYIPLLAHYYHNTRIPIVENGVKLLQDHVDHNINFLLNTNHPTNNKRKVDRYLLYQEHPEISFFDEFLINLFYLTSAKLCTTSSNDTCQRSIKLLTKINFEKIYYDKEVMIKDNSFMINSVFFLDYLKLNEANISAKVVDLVQYHYLDDRYRLRQDLKMWEYHSFIYILTHIIIAASQFYEKNVSQYAWISQFFAENIDEIIERTKIDIIAEVGLSIKLCQQQDKYHIATNKINEHILNHYDFDRMLTPKYLIKKEHSNSIIMLLFYDNSQWHSGPNLISK